MSCQRCLRRTPEDVDATTPVPPIRAAWIIS